MKNLLKGVLKIVGRVPNSVLGAGGVLVGGGAVATGGVSPECVEAVVGVLVGAFLAALGIGGAGQREADKGK